MGKLSKFFRNPFASMFESSSRQDQLTAYIIREHGAGRTIEDIMDDPYLKNRTTPEQRRRLLESPDVIRAITEHTDQARHSSGGGNGAPA
jgi:hypothetical protein